jgi:PAS domain S-box-containing protein
MEATPYRDLFESLPVALLRFAPDGRLLDANPAAAQALGYPDRATLLAITMTGLFSQAADATGLLAKLVRDGAVRDAEVQLRRRDGAMLWVWFSACAITDATGRVVSYEGVAQDITEWRQIREALELARAELKRLESALASAHMSWWDWDVLHDQLSYSDGFAVSDGAPEAWKPANYQAFLDEVHPEDRPRVAQTVAASLQHGADFNLEFRIIRPDGAERSITCHAWVYRNGHGQAVRMLGLAAENTEQKQAEKLLRESEERFRSLSQSSPLGILLTDIAGHWEYANPRCRKLWGFTLQQTIGDGWTQAVYPDDRSAVCDEWFACLREGRPFAREFRLQHRDGRIVWVHLRTVPMLTEDMKTHGHVGTVEDITERKRAEDALHRLSTRLLQFQDSERRRIARELHDSTGQNLAALAMHLTRLSESSADLPPDARQSLSTCLLLADQCSREIRILSYLLHPPMLDELGLASALQWYADGFGQRSGIKVDLEVPPDLGRLPQEVEIALFRVIQECLTNIHRHSGSATATIRLAKQPDRVVLEVQDAGRGMGIADTDGRPTELGVGVMGMRERVQELGGRLSIKSGPQGTTVRATLPIAGGVA